MLEAERITKALRGRWHGRYGLAFCPAHHNTRTPALRLGEGRDGRLLAQCSAGCAFADVAAALRSLGLLDGAGPVHAPDPEEAARRTAEETAEREKAMARARRIWAESLPIAGTLAERYLRARAILGPLSTALRFHPECWHGATAQRLPALVAAVTLEGEAEPVAIHRTYLAEPGAKAAVEPCKAMLGPVKGGAVKIATGAGPLVIAEGLETALTLADDLADLSPTVAAALSTSGVSGFALPPNLSHLVVAPDADPAGFKAAEALALRAYGLGARVTVLPPPPGEKGADWNDVARGAA